MKILHSVGWISFFFWIVFFLVMGGVFSVSLYISVYSENDALRINIAGRERMLSQKIIKEILLLKEKDRTAEDQKILLQRLQSDMRTFEEVLNVLSDSGDVRVPLLEGLEENANLVRATGEGKGSAILQLQKDWQNIKQRLENQMQNPGEPTSLRWLIRNEESFLRDIDRVVYIMQKDAEMRSLILRIMSFIAYILFFMIAYLIFRFLQAKMVNRQLEVRISREIEKNRESEILLTQQSRMAAMGEMIAMLTHQWMQPLNSLSVLVQNMIQDVHDGSSSREELEEELKRSMEQIRFMARTMDDFRNFFRPRRDETVFELSEAVDQAYFILRPQFRQEMIDLDVEVEREVYIKGYVNEFKQVILNLLTNSRDAIQDLREKRGLSMDAYPGKIQIHVARNTEHVILRVQDNGGGIDPDFLPAVFDAYVTSRKEKGTGIGLYMTRIILEKKLRGSIRLTNSGEGLMAELTFPMVERDGSTRAGKGGPV